MNDIKTELVENYIKENNLTKTKFCKLCGINYNQYQKFMANNLNFDVIVLFRIGRLINVKVYQLFK